MKGLQLGPRTLTLAYTGGVLILPLEIAAQISRANGLRVLTEYFSVVLKRLYLTGFKPVNSQ